jgi:ankyrin repeat protein
MQGDVGAVQHLLQNGVNVDSQDQKSRTPLVLVAARERTPIMELLIKAGALTNGLNRKMPLSSAAMHGQVKSVRVLISYGAKVNKMDHARYPPRHSAVMVGHLAAIQLLLNHKAQQKCCEHDEQYPLHIAGEYKFAKQFFQHAIECEQTGNYDRVMYYNDTTCCAPEKKVLATVQCLLAHGAEVDAIDEDGVCPLHQAAAYEDTAIVRLLIENDADINATSSRGNTPLKYALKHQQEAMVHLLKEHGAVVN